ncbi:cathepsin L-like isoform X1 [Diorhabda sublineata]|uniref:cathepsin L-like isoform X1 n=1 Tax=Diorhabda sublineata TaxID=1163346 RepID=UPI0024E163BF|nr:cathepsin L-like isoform X1 [Diorhabda sublineata]
MWSGNYRLDFNKNKMGVMKLKIVISLTLFVSVVVTERSRLPNLGLVASFLPSNNENVAIRVTKIPSTPAFGFPSRTAENVGLSSKGNSIGFEHSSYASSSSNGKSTGGYDYSSRSDNNNPGGTYSFPSEAGEKVPVDSLQFFNHNLHEQNNHIPPFAIIPVNVSYNSHLLENFQNKAPTPPSDNSVQMVNDLAQRYISTHDTFDGSISHQVPEVTVGQLQPLAPVSSVPRFEQIIEREWNDFTIRFNKVYSSEQEARYRREIFIENRAKIMRFNAEYAEGKRSFVHKINEFADMLLHEFSENLNGFNRSTRAPSVPLKPATTFLPSANVVFPDSVDWRIVGAVGPVKSQGNCAACWAFAAAGALEGHHFRKTGSLVEVSPQNLIDCTQPYGNNGCSGGLMDPAFEYVRDNNGVDSEPSYPFEQKNGECRFKRENVVATCTGFVDIGENDEKGIEIALATLGPVTAAIDASQETFQFYSEGIYDDPKCGNKPEQMNHAVLIVGYGQEADGRKYWLVKNSYGQNWGIGGYIKIAKENNNQCGIAIQASYPLV